MKKSYSGSTLHEEKCQWKQICRESESAGTIARESGMILQFREIAAQICCFIALQIYRKAIGIK